MVATHLFFVHTLQTQAQKRKQKEKKRKATREKMNENEMRIRHAIPNGVVGRFAEMFWKF